MNDIEISICSDCLMLHANGDTSGMDDETRVRVLTGAGIDSGELVIVGDKDFGFCKSRCDTCLDHHHGDRFQAFFIR